MMWWHRIRGHRLQQLKFRLYSDTWIESGRIDNVTDCSCGAQWSYELINPLFSEWRWVRVA